MGAKVNEKIILGVDPGTRVMGYGIIEVKNSQLRIIQYGVLRLEKLFNQPLEKKFYDATDALAVGVCHFMHSGTKALTGNGSKKSGWSAFLSENPERIK